MFIINEVKVTGRLTQDPQIRQTGTGTKMAKFTIAHNDRNNNASYFDCTVFGRAAERVEQAVHKGTAVLVYNAELVQNNWEDQNGQKRSKLQLQNGSVKVFDAPSKGGNRAETDQTQQTPPYQSQTSAAPTPPSRTPVPAYKQDEEYMEVPNDPMWFD